MHIKFIWNTFITAGEKMLMAYAGNLHMNSENSVDLFSVENAIAWKLVLTTLKIVQVFNGKWIIDFDF